MVAATTAITTTAAAMLATRVLSVASRAAGGASGPAGLVASLRQRRITACSSSGSRHSYATITGGEQDPSASADQSGENAESEVQQQPRVAPSVRTLVEAGVVVSPVRNSVRRRRAANKKPVTQELLAAVEEAEADAARKAGINTYVPPSPLADTAFTFQYRRARARLWTPTAIELRQAEDTDLTAWQDAQIQSYADSLQSEPEKHAAYSTLSREEQLDFALYPTWQAMSEEDRTEGILRMRFDCARKLGWRRGFSAGFPYLTTDVAIEHQDDADMLAQLSIPQVPAEADSTVRALLERIHSGKDAADALAAQRELLRLDEERAWASFKALPESVRLAEEREAWTNRDRSRIYLDDTPASSVCLKRLPRWFPQPQRAGTLNFLPNIIVRLVRNYTPPGQDYDVWKATFRIPLSMHKHALRSYLLAIYGLRTTWARSMIYRSKLVREGGGRLSAGSKRTFKKVEVGLLEPFLWPGVNPTFLANRMLVHEMQFEAQRAYMKMTRTARWRASRSADPLLEQVNEGVQHGVLEGSDAAKLVKIKPRVMTKSGGIPTAKHGRILAMLLQKKTEREAEIRGIVAERAVAADSGSTASAQQPAAAQ
ncbi:hypothetical protein V8E36_008549 [Tilletia maclaganii]